MDDYKGEYYIRKCIFCNAETTVLDSRVKSDGRISRKRKCLKCGYTFRTAEIEECMLETSELNDEVKELESIINKLNEKIVNINKILNWR